MVGQSDPLFVPTSSLMKTPTPSTDDPAQEDLLQKYQEQVEKLSQQNCVIKLCTEAGFPTTVEVGQYFMTKDTEEFSQFTESVACREYTLPRDEKSSDPKGWIRENTKIGPVLEVTTSYLQGKFGAEIRMESVNKDNYHSWVRISHGLNKLVTGLSNNKEDDNNEQETSEMQFEDFALKTNVLAYASRSKAKAKPRRRTPACSSTRTVPIGERFWTEIEPENYSSIAYPVSKQLSTLLRHGDLPRDEDGAIEFWRIKVYLRSQFLYSQHWYDELWKSKMAGGGGNKKRFQYCTHPSHIGCAINLHSTTNSGLIRGGQILSKRQTVFFTSVAPMNKEYRDSNKIDLEAPRLAHTCRQRGRNIKTQCIGSTSDLLKRKDLSSIKQDRTQSSFTTRFPAYCIPKAIMTETGEIIYEKVFASPRMPQKISFEDNWMKELGSEVAGGSEDSQQTQPKTKNPIVRTGRPV